MDFLPVYVYFIAISFLVSITVFFRVKDQDKYLKLFPPFLLATLAAETVSSYRSSIGKNNIDIYNYFTTFEFCFYLYILSLLINNQRIKQVIRVMVFAYALVAVINILVIQKANTFHSTTYALGCLIIVAFCVYYFFELFRLPKSVKLKNNPAFWICSGLLFFYCCGFPLYGLINSLGGISSLIMKNFEAILTILNIFLYSLYTIAFLCRAKSPKYTL